MLTLLARREYDALAAARTREGTREGRRFYALRQGVEGTMSQAVRACGLRRARFRGLAETSLQHVATAAAINLDRLAAWLSGRPLAPTRTSRFAALGGLVVTAGPKVTLRKPCWINGLCARPWHNPLSA